MNQIKKMKNKLKKVNWYDEELHKFYDTKKDNDGFIHGIYVYDGDNVIDVGEDGDKEEYMELP